MSTNNNYSFNVVYSSLVMSAGLDVSTAVGWSPLSGLVCDDGESFSPAGTGAVVAVTAQLDAVDSPLLVVADDDFSSPAT